MEIRAAVGYLLRNTTGGGAGSDIVQEIIAIVRQVASGLPLEQPAPWTMACPGDKRTLKYTLGGTMIDLSYSRQRDHEDRAAARARWRRLIIPAVVAFIFIGVGLPMVWGFGGTRLIAPSPSAAPAREQVSNELLETTKGLEITQQQAVDQLQVVQDQLAAQQAVTKKLSEQIATLTEKLDVLQQSVADHPSPSVTAPLPPPQPSKARGK